jgi:hypothetical protein
MSDPYVKARALMAREAAARVLQEGGAVRLRGPTAAGEEGGKSYNSRLSVMSSSVALGHVVPGVPRGARGVIVRGKDGQAKYLVANGFTYRHLTPDLRVHVLFPHGQRTVPADWLEEVLEDATFHTPPTAVSGNDDSAPRPPVRGWKQTLATREKQWQELQRKKGEESSEVELVDEKSSSRLGSYNAMYPRRPAKSRMTSSDVGASALSSGYATASVFQPGLNEPFSADAQKTSTRLTR